MIDLCSGLGGASRAMRKRGWMVISVDNESTFHPDIVADVRQWSWTGARPFLMWASPPCTEFSREFMPWCKTGKAPDMSIVQACVRVIMECNPRWWVIENVKGAIPWFRPILGEFRQSCGPFFLWGNFHPFRLSVKGFKERLTSKARAKRAEIPLSLSEAICVSLESDLFNEIDLTLPES